MKKSNLLIAILLVATMMGACKKDQDVTPAPVPIATVNYYAVKYEFTSNNTSASDFYISYVDADGNYKNVNGSSGWTMTFSAKSNQHMHLSVQSFTMNASVTVNILVNGSVVRTDFKDGVGTATAMATADYNLPQ